MFHHNPPSKGTPQEGNATSPPATQRKQEDHQPSYDNPHQKTHFHPDNHPPLDLPAIAHAAPLEDPDTSPFPPPPPNPYPTLMNTAHTTTKKAPAQRTTRPRLLPPNAHQRSHTKPTRIRSNESYLKTPFSARTRFPKKHFNESNRNESHPRARRLPPKTAPPRLTGESRYPEGRGAGPSPTSYQRKPVSRGSGRAGQALPPKTAPEAA